MIFEDREWDINFVVRLSQSPKFTKIPPRGYSSHWGGKDQSLVSHSYLFSEIKCRWEMKI